MIEGINVENALRTIKSRQNLLKELMRRTESARHQFNLSAETQQYLQTLLQELAQMIRKSEWFYRDYWFLKQEEMAEKVQQINEALDACVRQRFDEDSERARKAAEENLRRLIGEFIRLKQEIDKKSAAEMEQRRILVKQIIAELNEIANKIQFTDAEVTEFNRVNNSNYSKQNLTSILKQALKDFEKRLREDIANNNEIIDFEKEFMEALHKLGITGEAAKLFLKSKLGALSRFVFQKKYEALNAKREQNEISRMESVRAADKKQEKIEQKQEKVEQEQEKVEQEQEKVEQEQKALETEAKTEIAVEAQTNTISETEAEIEKQHPLKKFLDSFSSIVPEYWSNDAVFKATLLNRVSSYLEKIPKEEREKAEDELVRHLQAQKVFLDAVQDRKLVTGIFDRAIDSAAKNVTKVELAAETHVSHDKKRISMT